MQKQATEAVQAALKQGVRRIEIEYPVDPGRIDVSLGTLYPALRQSRHPLMRLDCFRARVLSSEKWEAGFHRKASYLVCLICFTLPLQGEFLDESRRWTREFIRPFTTKGQKLWVVFPDGKEATLARSKWGETNFRVMGLKTAKEAPKEEACELMVIVTPGFNIDEFLDLEKVDRGVPVIIGEG